MRGLTSVKCHLCTPPPPPHAPAHHKPIKPNWQDCSNRSDLSVHTLTHTHTHTSRLSAWDYLTSDIVTVWIIQTSECLLFECAPLILTTAGEGCVCRGFCCGLFRLTSAPRRERRTPGCFIYLFFSNVFCFQTSAAASALVSVNRCYWNRKKSQERAACRLA